jgi:hypothetical protein
LTTRSVTFHFYRPADLDEIELLPDEAKLIRDSAEFFSGLSSQPGAFCGTARLANKIVYIGGYYPTEEGTVQVFIIPDKRAVKNPIAFFRTVLLWRKRVESLPGVNRIETFSILTWRISKWMKRCGFACVGETTRYTEAGVRFMIWRRSKVDGIWGH